MTVWEIYSYAVLPYAEISSNQDVFKFVVNGGRLTPPSNSPPSFQELMKSCWKEQPSSRPSFSSIVDEIEKTLEQRELETKTAVEDAPVIYD